jgi:peptidoglycan/LPS O-acetylase OafA/YrhL
MTETPRTFDSLTGLRFILALWIAVFHLGDMYDHAGWGSHPFMRAGIARVDLFFVLSGFVLTHIYWARMKGAFDFGAFLQARVARLVPLHLLALAIIGVIVVAGVLTGRTEEVSNYTLHGLLANLLLLGAWGIPNSGAWNFPAWAISAEFTGYLLFPLFLALATCFRTRPLLFLALVLGLAALTDLLFRIILGRSLVESTGDLGSIRGAVVMLAGVSARVAFEAFGFSARGGTILAVAGLAIAITAAALEISTAMIAAGGVLLMMGLAARDMAGANSLLDSPLMVRLGQWSYAIFILHVPLYMLMFNAAAFFGHALVMDVLTSAIMVTILLMVSAFAHHMIEEPARKLIKGSGRGPTPQAAPA